MRHPHLLISTFGLLLAASASAAVSPAPAAPAAPSAPAAKAARPAPIPTDDYELRGFFGFGDKLEVSIAKKGAPGATWVSLGKKRGGITLEQASPKEGTAVITTGGKRLLVRLTSENAPSSNAAGIDDGRLPESLKKLTPEQQIEAAKAFESFFNNMSDAQQQLMQEEMQKRMSSDPAFAAAMMKVRGPGQKPTEQDQANLSKIMTSHLTEALKKVATVPGKDGVLRPAPAHLDDLMKFRSPITMSSPDSEGGN